MDAKTNSPEALFNMQYNYFWHNIEYYFLSVYNTLYWIYVLYVGQPYVYIVWVLEMVGAV
jgi:hypothetical protein